MRQQLPLCAALVGLLTAAITMPARGQAPADRPAVRTAPPARPGTQPARQNAPTSRGEAPRTAAPATRQSVRQAGAMEPGEAPVRRASGQSNAAPVGQVPARRPAGAKAPAGPVANVPLKNVAPQAPFTLTAAQQKLLDEILLKWEKQSDKVKTFSCSFTRWEYDKAYGNPVDDFKKSQGEGIIRFKAPDTGLYQVESLQEFDFSKKVVKPRTDGLDHWICDGKAIWEYNAEKKQLIERRLPPELQGKAISEGPLPFIFGAKADQLKKRYWLRDVTPTEEVGKTIRIEAVPKYQQDAANFSSATVILNDSDCIPQALRIMLPGGTSNTDYLFNSSKANGLLAALDFAYPKLTPLMMAQGWKKVVEEPPAAEPSKDEPPAVSEPIQAKRGAPSTQRK